MGAAVGFLRHVACSPGCITPIDCIPLRWHGIECRVHLNTVKVARDVVLRLGFEVHGVVWYRIILLCCGICTVCFAFVWRCRFCSSNASWLSCETVGNHECEIVRVCVCRGHSHRRVPSSTSPSPPPSSHFTDSGKWQCQSQARDTTLNVFQASRKAFRRRGRSAASVLLYTRLQATASRSILSQHHVTNTREKSRLTD